MFIPSIFTSVSGQEKYSELSFLESIYLTTFPPLLETLKEITIPANKQSPKKCACCVESLCGQVSQEGLLCKLSVSPFRLIFNKYLPST